MKSANTCIICGKPLTGRRTKYCSNTCARIGANNLAREVSSQYPHPKPFHTITCPDCGIEVTVPIKSKRCPACQLLADRRHGLEHKQRKRLGKTRQIGSTDLCRRCGKPYTVWGGRQKYCKDCAQIAFAEADRTASREWNKKRYSDPANRLERNKKRLRPTPAEATCPICGKAFTPTSTRNVYCSPECYQTSAKSKNEQYAKEHRQQITDQKRKARQLKLATMTPEELTEYREKINARARENYKKRQKK